MLPSLRDTMTAVAQGRHCFCTVFHSFTQKRRNEPVLLDKILPAREQIVLTVAPMG